MNVLLKSANVYTDKGFVKRDISICDNRISFNVDGSFDKIENLDGLYIVPGFVDVHVHLREPGFLYKETIKTGTMAAAHGGFTAVCSMPNLNPAPSDFESLKVQLDAIEKDAVVRVYPYGTITEGRNGRGGLARMEETAPYVLGYSDDGTGVQGKELMEEAMMKAKQLDRIIVAHCEDESELKPGGCIHDGVYAKEHNHVGINSESEWKQVERDIELAERLNVRYHVCHISTKETVDLIRKAKKRGVKVTCETGPHYLIYTDMDLKEDGGWKMNPPIRSAEDRAALIEGIKDGTIDCIITDHAPHSKEEKSRGLDKSAFGIVGLETSFSTVYTNLVKTGIISLEKMIELMCLNPRRIFDIAGSKDGLKEGDVADITVLDLNKEYDIDASKFYSMGKSTLFDGCHVAGEVVSTYVDGKKVYPFNI
ncbi:MAG: dihydroorotase [Eubacteriales bacterium]|nr:dihydroorotase [Eubacteriales bacterium]